MNFHENVANGVVFGEGFQVVVDDDAGTPALVVVEVLASEADAECGGVGVDIDGALKNGFGFVVVVDVVERSGEIHVSGEFLRASVESLGVVVTGGETLVTRQGDGTQAVKDQGISRSFLLQLLEQIDTIFLQGGIFLAYGPVGLKPGC